MSLINKVDKADITWLKPHISNLFKNHSLISRPKCKYTVLKSLPLGLPRVSGGSFYRPAQQHAIWLQSCDSGKTIMSIIDTRRQPIEAKICGHRQLLGRLQRDCHCYATGHYIPWYVCGHLATRDSCIGRKLNISVSKLSQLKREKSLRNQGRIPVRWKRN